MENETKTIKALRPIQYKDEVSLDEGQTADVAAHVADRLIAAGNAVEVEAKASKKKGDKSE